MVKVREDLTGKNFGKLIVIEQAEDYIESNGRHRDNWKCQCECGKYVDVVGRSLKSGNSKSCGCFQKESMSKATKRYNDYEIQEDYVIMYTIKGESFIVDLDDFWKVKNICWHTDKDGYARGYLNGKSIFLHRYIMKCSDDMIVDHINHDVADNRKCNLRIVTISQNCMNRRLATNNSSGVTGVYLNKSTKKWESYIKAKGDRICIGRFTNIDDAIKARKEAEEKYFGEYSYDNSIGFNN